jgi:hypothetical protein
LSLIIILYRMKLLLFAHVPPPHHGQSYMVKLILDGIGGDQRKRTFFSAQFCRRSRIPHEDVGDRAKNRIS